MKHRRLVAVAAALGTLVPAATAAASPVAPARAHAAAKPTIVEIAAGDKRFSTLVSLVKKAGLAETLSGGSYTVFAPTNAAFNKVPKKTLKALAKDKAALKRVLLYHVLAGRVPAKKVVKLSSAETVEGSSVSITVKKNGKVFLDGTRRVTATDIQASNGIVHVINGVLLPPS